MLVLGRYGRKRQAPPPGSFNNQSMPLNMLVLSESRLYVRLQYAKVFCVFECACLFDVFPAVFYNKSLAQVVIKEKCKTKEVCSITERKMPKELLQGIPTGYMRL